MDQLDREAASDKNPSYVILTGQIQSLAHCSLFLIQETPYYKKGKNSLEKFAVESKTTKNTKVFHRELFALYGMVIIKLLPITKSS